MIFSLTMVEDFDVDGAIWKIGDNEYIVQKNRCGEDDLYWTDSLEEARKEFIGEEEEEELQHIKLEDGMKLMDLIVEYETLSMPQLRKLMEEQGYYLDKEHLVIRKK